MDKPILFKHSKIYDGGLDQWKYSDLCEELIMDIINERTNISPIAVISQGNVPEWDFLHEDSTYSELKTSLRRDTNVHIEIWKSPGVPSGLNITKAEHYFFVNVGANSSIPEGVGKIRRIKTADLKEYIEKRKDRLVHCYFNQGTPQNSVCICVDFWDLPTMEWICDVPLIIEDELVIGYDFNVNHIIRMNKYFEKEINHE